MEISKFGAQKKISILWFINSAILFLIFIWFTIVNRFDDHSQKGWEWYSQNVIPILFLMFGTFFSTKNQQQKDKTVNVFYYRLCFGISIFYLSVLYITILAAPIAFSYANLSIIDLLDKSKIYLIIIQGLLTYSLGLFFNKEG